ncbi:MAG: permease [Candidatus Margulisbacteria bacterium]|nr:permease [Candidatus Margulisiibacteriota bacterium]
MAIENPICASCSPIKKEPFWTNKIIIMLAIYGLVFVAGQAISSFALLWNSLSMYIATIAVPVIIGLLLGGVIDWLVPREYVSALLAQKKKRTVIYAVLTGFLMSVCSHGILALAIQLYKKGASPPAVIAFLLASPWANLPLTLIMFGFFGVKAFYIIFSAVIIALITGWLYLILDNRNWIERNPNTAAVDAGFSMIADIKARIDKIKLTPASAMNGLAAILRGSISLANMVLWWIMLGVFLAGISAAFLPEHFMHQYMGPTFLGMLVTLFVATIMEICSEGTAPLAFEIYRQTGALGNSLVFLMAGVVTDYTEIGLIWTNIGWRTAVWLPIITVPQVLVLGYIANLIFK